MDWALIALAVWWTLAVIFAVLMLDYVDRNLLTRAYAVGICAAWPLLVPVAVVYLCYDMSVKSTARIRTDLKNRKILAEFEDWLDERNKGKILTKEEADAE